MKRYIILVCFTVLGFILNAQDAKSILTESAEKTSNLLNGKYKMESYSQMENDDKISRVLQEHECIFEVVEEEELFGVVFHDKYNSTIGENGGLLYTGGEMISYRNKTNEGRIISPRDYVGYSDYIFLLSSNRLDKVVKDRSLSLEYIGQEKIKNYDCHHIKIDLIKVEEKEEDDVKIDELHYWINIEDGIIVQDLYKVKKKISGISINQFQKRTITEYEFNSIEDRTILGHSSLPEDIVLEDYVREKEIEHALLPKGTPAPEWSFKRVGGGKLDLSKYRGKLVLLDFFHERCTPCVMALPELKRLREKYKSKGFEIIGYSYLDSEEALVSYMKRKKIDYPIVIGDEMIEKEKYKVRLHPTFYLLDKEGQIIFSQEGYGPTSDIKGLEQMIIGNLK